MASFPPPLSPTPASQPLPGDRSPGGASVGGDRGVAWWSEAWRLFTAAPVEWIVIMVLMCAITIGVALVPVLGQFASMLLSSIFFGGVMTGCRSLQRGGKLQIGDLFACFSNDRLMPLFIVGLIYLAGWFIIWVVTAVLIVAVIGAGSIGALLTGDPVQAGVGMLAAFSLGALVIALVTLLLTVPLLMAFWFAPALVALRGDEPVAAMKTSFNACLRNFVPFLVYGLLGLLLAIAATIPFGLGWFVLLPVCAASVYTSYRDIFGD